MYMYYKNVIVIYALLLFYSTPNYKMSPFLIHLLKVTTYWIKFNIHSIEI
jgi:hypothetical protein